MGEPRFDRRLAAQARERAGLQLSPDDQALLAQQLPPADAQQFAAQEVQAPGLVEELQALLAPQQPTPQQAFLQQAGPQTADATSAAPAESAAERSERLRRAAMGPPIAPEDRGVAGRTVTPQTDALRQAEREGTPTFVPPLTNAPSATGLGPQTLLGIRTGDEESAAPGEPRRARAEAGGTTSEARLAPGPNGSLVFDIPELAQQPDNLVEVPPISGIIIPPSMLSNPAELGAALDQAVVQWEENPTTEPAVLGDPNARLSLDQTEVLRAQLRIMAARQRGQDTGVAEPRLDVTRRIGQTIPGQASAEALAARDRANAVVMASQLGGVTAQRDLGLAGAIGSQQIQGAHQAAADEAAKIAQVRQQQTDEAIVSFRQAADEVSSRRIDPGQIFGGFGGRIGAAIAVALGEAGRALTGGDSNVALGIINQAVERSMQAQQANLQNEQFGVRNQGEALNRMLSTFRDRTAAEHATRALHLRGVEAQVSSMMEGATGRSRAAMAQLQQAVRQQIAAQEQVAHEIEANSTSVRDDVRVRGPQSTVQRTLGGLPGLLGVGRGVSPGQTGAAQGASEGEQQRDADTVARSAVESFVGGVGAAAEAGFQPITGADLGEEAQNLLNGAREARARGNTRGAEAAERAVGGRVSRVAERRARARHRPLVRISESDFAAMREEAGLHRRTPRPPAGFTLIPGQSTALYNSLFSRENGTPTASGQEVFRDMQTLQSWDRLFPIIDRANQELGAEFFNHTQLGALGAEAAALLRDAYRVSITGAAAPQEELERLEARFRDPNLTADMVSNLWGELHHQWSAAYQLHVTRLSDNIRIRGGLQPDNAHSQNIREMNRVNAEWHERAARSIARQ